MEWSLAHRSPIHHTTLNENLSMAGIPFLLAITYVKINDFNFLINHIITYVYALHLHQNLLYFAFFFGTQH